MENLEIGNRPGNKSYLKRFWYFFLDGLRMVIVLMKNDYQVVHLNPSLKKFSLLRDSCYFILIKIFRKKSLVMFHGWDEDLASKLIKSYCWRKLFKNIYKNADCLIVLCNFFRKRLIEFGLIPERIKVLTTMYQKAEEPTHNPFRVLSEEKINLLFLSRFVESKGIYIAAQVGSLLIEKGYRNFKLVFAGDGPEYKGLVHYIKKYELEEYIELKGYVTGKEKQEILDSSDIFLFPTFYGEGCPVSVLEAMGAGLAIVSTPVGAIPEIVDHKTNGLIINSRDSKEFFKAVKELIENRDLLQRMQKLNREKAESNYEARLVTRRVESIYLSILHA